jgi:hypothetical protein
VCERQFLGEDLRKTAIWFLSIYIFATVANQISWWSELATFNFYFSWGQSETFLTIAVIAAALTIIFLFRGFDVAAAALAAVSISTELLDRAMPVGTPFAVPLVYGIDQFQGRLYGGFPVTAYVALVEGTSVYLLLAAMVLLFVLVGKSGGTNKHQAKVAQNPVGYCGQCGAQVFGQFCSKCGSRSS